MDKIIKTAILVITISILSVINTFNTMATEIDLLTLATSSLIIIVGISWHSSMLRNTLLAIVILFMASILLISEVFYYYARYLDVLCLSMFWITIIYSGTMLASPKNIRSKITTMSAYILPLSAILIQLYIAHSHSTDINKVYIPYIFEIIPGPIVLITTYALAISITDIYEATYNAILKRISNQSLDS